MKPLTIIFTIISIVFTTSCVFAAQASCSSDSACNFGLCTPSGNSSFCSCLSGFGGSNCQIRPSSNCTVHNVSSESTNFDPFVTLAYSYPSQVLLDVTVPVEESIFEIPSVGSPNNTAPYSLETTIYFGNGSFPECSFPNTLWQDLAASSSDCVDRYRLNISFVDVVNKCGFSDEAQNRTYEQTITIDRKYLVLASRGYNLTRTDSRSFTLKIIFPEGANVSTPNIRVSYTASATPSATASGTPPPLTSYSVVTMTIASTLADFSPAQFAQDIASVLNITADRIIITGMTVSNSKGVSKRAPTITVQFKILDIPGSSAATLANTLVQLVESDDPVLANYGLTVVGMTVDNSNAGGQSSSEESNHHHNNNILLYAVIIPGTVVLLGLVVASILIARRLRSKPDRPDLPDAPSPDKTPGISPVPSFPEPPTPELVALPDPPKRERTGIQQNKYPERLTPTTRVKSRQVTLQLMEQLQIVRQQTNKNNNNNNRNNNNNNNTTNTNTQPANADSSDEEDNQPISRPPSYTTALYDPSKLAVQPSMMKRANTKLSQGAALKPSQTQLSRKSKVSKAPVPSPKPAEENSDSDSSWIATPDSLTSDSDE